MYENITIEKVKYIRNNRYGHVVHTMATGALQLAICVKYDENGESTNSVFEDMVIKINFGHNKAALTDLTGLMRDTHSFDSDAVSLGTHYIQSECE